jgi:DNA-binding transcriptional ArsR family regulator
MSILTSPLSTFTPPLQPNLISFNKLEQYAYFFRLLSSPVRTRILDFLDLAESPQCVTEIIAVCEGAQQCIISQQLRLLKNGGIIVSAKDGNRVFYKIVHPEVRQYLKLLRESM